MKRVPNSWGGASRRAYQHAYSKSSSAKIGDLLGSKKLSTPAFKAARGGKQLSQKTKAKSDAPDLNVSFGATGFTKEDYYG